MSGEKCLFCEIVAGREPGKKVWENDDFLCIENKYPKAPVHVLVMPKEHVEKSASLDSSSQTPQNDGGWSFDVFWGKMMGAVFGVVHKLNLSKTGYKLVSNGAGYNHFEHEHIHVLGGSKHEPAGQT